MLNEGMVTNDTKTLVKSALIQRIRDLGPTTPDLLERAVFEAVTGHAREDVDWDIEDNQAGYYLWLRAFDGLVEELIEDGYIRVDEAESSGARTLVPIEGDPAMDVSQFLLPS